MNRMPVGMYLPGESFLHRLHPLTKLFGFLMLVAAAVFTDSLRGYALAFAFICWLIALSGIPPSICLANLRRVYWFFILILCMNAFFFESGEYIWRGWIFTLSAAGIMQGVNVAVRLVILIIAGGIFTATTPPMEITSAIRRLLMPLRFVGIPVDILALIISVAIRFIPVLSNESGMIIMAQRARGARLNKNMLPLLVPVFLCAFKRADELAMAMEARGYRTGRKPRKVRHTPLQLRDINALLVAAGVLTMQAVL
jgi:energy-coupling factor transport system permease protein